MSDATPKLANRTRPVDLEGYMRAQRAIFEPIADTHHGALDQGEILSETNDEISRQMGWKWNMV